MYVFIKLSGVPIRNYLLTIGVMKIVFLLNRSEFTDIVIAIAHRTREGAHLSRNDDS